MAIQVNTIIESARFEHPLWERLRQPHGAIIRRLGLVQDELFTEAIKYDRNFMAQRLSLIVKETTFEDYPQHESETPPAFDLDSAGKLVGIDPAATASYSGQANSATANTLTDTDASWTVNAYANYYVLLIIGTGAGQWRKIAGNTPTVLTVGDNWTTTPDATTVYRIYSAVQAAYWWDEAAGERPKAQGAAMTIGKEPAATHRAYAVVVGTDGAPQINLNEPIEIKYRVGIPMPEYHRICGINIYRSTSSQNTTQIEGSVVSYDLRFQPPRRPACYVLNDHLYLLEPGTDWRWDDQIELNFVPVPPTPEAPADYFLLPDQARPLLHWAACQALEKRKPTGEAAEWNTRFDKSKAEFLQSLSAKWGIRRVKEVW